MKTAVLEKVLANLEHIDRQDLEKHFSDLAKSQMLICAALDTLPEGVLLIDSHARIVHMNAAARNIFSIPDSLDKKWVVSEKWMDKALSGLILDVVNRRENLIGREIRILTPRSRILNISVMAIQENPEKYGFVLIVEDKTHSGENARDQIHREKLQSIMTLVQGIAHEIGNPLNSIVIQLKLLQKEAARLPAQKSERIQGSVEILLEETRRLDRIVHQFLNLTRRPPLRLRKTNLNRVVQDVVKFMAHELRERKITYTLELNSEIPAFLADGEQLHRAFLNIVKNGMESMPDGGKLTIRTERIDKLVKISFRDEGVGIPEEDAKRIFDLYYTTKDSGSGLGLAIVKSIIEEHEGRIEVESKIGRGSVFTVILPIRQNKLELPAAVGKENAA